MKNGRKKKIYSDTKEIIPYHEKYFGGYLKWTLIFSASIFLISTPIVISRDLDYPALRIAVLTSLPLVAALYIHYFKSLRVRLEDQNIIISSMLGNKNIEVKNIKEVFHGNYSREENPHHRLIIRTDNRTYRIPFEGPKRIKDTMIRIEEKYGIKPSKTER